MAINGFFPPFNFFKAITASDTVNIVPPPGEAVPVQGTLLGIYVGGAGNLVAVMPNSDTATFVGIPAGTILPISCIRVNSTNTTATSLLGLWRF